MAHFVFRPDMHQYAVAKKYSARITPKKWEEHREAIINEYKRSTLRATVKWMKSELKFVVS